MSKLLWNHRLTRIGTASFLVLTIIFMTLMTTLPTVKAASYANISSNVRNQYYPGETVSWTFNLTVLDSQGGSPIPINNVNITVWLEMGEPTYLMNTQTSTPAASFTNSSSWNLFWDFSADGDLTAIPQARVSLQASYSSSACAMAYDYQCTAKYHEDIPGGIDQVKTLHSAVKVMNIPPVTTTFNPSGPITLGQSVNDTATFASLGEGGIPGGPVDFYWGTSTSGPWTHLGTQKKLKGGMATSDNFTPTAVGDYYFYVHYLGADPYSTTNSSLEHLVVVAPFSVSINPKSYTLKPGNTASYAINVTNLGNTADSFNLALQYTDFGMKYRALPTVIQQAWTTIDKTLIGPLNPGAYDIATLTISVPADWAGMETTTYEFNATATMVGDTHVPPLNATAFANVTVQATKASMTKYIGLELQSLMNQVGSSTLWQFFKNYLKFNVLMYAINLDSMASSFILNGNQANANSVLVSCEKTVMGFISCVMNLKQFGLISTATANNWIANATTIINDLNMAIPTPP
jgi:hypothetical protein